MEGTKGAQPDPRRGRWRRERDPGRKRRGDALRRDSGRRASGAAPSRSWSPSPGRRRVTCSLTHSPSGRWNCRSTGRRRSWFLGWAAS